MTSKARHESGSDVLGGAARGYRCPLTTASLIPRTFTAEGWSASARVGPAAALRQLRGPLTARHSLHARWSDDHLESLSDGERLP
jgi:hypothetical protein